MIVYGTRPVIIAGALLSALGLWSVALSTDAVTAIIGFGASGIGAAVVFPLILSAAGRHGTHCLTYVVAFGYSGLLIGPPAVGFIIDAWGLGIAVGVIGSCAFSIGVLSAAMPSVSDQGTS